MIQIFNQVHGRLRLFLLAAAFVFSLGHYSSQAEAQQFTPEELDIIASVNKYLNSFQNLKGKFVQVGPSGRYTNGQFFLSRPGRVRFEYEPPSPLMIVADGSWVSIENRQLKTSEHYPLSATPLKIILADNINLLKNADISNVFRDKSIVTLALRDKGSTKSGQITLVFQARDMALKEWIVIDDQGYRTRISVSDLVIGIKQNPKMFFIKKPDFPESER